MRKVFTAFIFTLYILTSTSHANSQVDPDKELHRVMGGLYSLASVVELNGSPTPSVNQLSKFFTNIPTGWQKTVKLSRVKNSIWAGISIGNYSSARHFLRSHAQELSITTDPEGYTWLGGDYAWLKVAEISNGKPKSIALIASRGSGNDSNVIFFRAQGQNSWWQANPDMTPQAAELIMKRCGIRNSPELHSPEGVSTSVYDTVRPADVPVPDEMHVGRTRTSFDVEFEIGDVIFDPIPNRTGN